MKTKKRIISMLLVLILVAGLLAGCSSKSVEPAASSTAEPTETTVSEASSAEQSSAEPTAADAEKTYSKKLIIGTATPMTVFDPQAIYDKVHCELFNLVYNQLVSYNFETHELEPELAVEWKVQDAKTYWFKLSEGIKFSNGEELTADDVLYSFAERGATATAQNAVFASIESVEVINDYELIIHLNKDDADFLNRMYIQSFAICNREACEADAENGYKVGTGGWVIDELIGSDHATFTRFMDSWVWGENGVNPTEEIEFRYMGEASTRQVALESGDIVVDVAIPITNYASAAANENLAVELHAAENLDYFIFNMKSGVCADDDNLRMAIAYAIDIDELNAYVQDGQASRAYTMWGKNQYGYYDGFENKLEFNLDTAKEYIAKSNHPDGCDFNIFVDSYFEPYATLIQAQLKKIGVNVIVNVTDKAGLTTTVEQGAHDAIVTNISLQSIGDRFHFVCNPNSSTNRALYTNEEMLAKFDEALAETDDAKRKELYKEIQTELNDVKPYVPFFYEVLCVGINKNLENYVWSADDKCDYTHIRLPE